MHIFYIGQGNSEPRQIVERARKLYKYTTEKYKGAPPHITLSLSDWNTHFEGDWDEWANGVINRKNAITRERVYDTYVTETLNLGRANWMILDRAIRHKFPCCYWDGETITNIREIQVLDESDYSVTGICVI